MPDPQPLPETARRPPNTEPTTRPNPLDHLDYDVLIDRTPVDLNRGISIGMGDDDHPEDS